MHLEYMKEALKEAQKAFEMDEVPVGAIVVYRGNIVGRGHNLRESLQDPLAHAEIMAIKEASKKLKTWKLNECTLYVTLEPCIMCAGAIIQARVGKVVYGAKDLKGGALGDNLNILEYTGFNHYPKVENDVLAEPSRKVLKQYFKEKRNNQMKIRKIETQDQLEIAKQIRTKVFVEEQKVDPSLEYDEYDSIDRSDVFHILAMINNEAVATLRLIKEGKTLKVGRVAVLKDYRKQGIGMKIMHYAEKYACNNGFETLVLGAQLQAIPFYEANGYVAYGDIYMDADIEHRMMKKSCK